MTGRAGVLPMVGAAILLVTGCSLDGTPSPASASDALAVDVTNRDFCGLVTADQLSDAAFPVTAGQPLNAGPASFCRFAASDGAGSPVPDSVMIGALPSGAAGAGESVEIDGVAGSTVLTGSECTLLVEAQGGTLQIVVARAGQGSRQCEMAQSVAASIQDRQ